MTRLIEELFDKNKKIAVAVSGGADSMSLLHMTLAAARGRAFLAFTVNHHIRERSHEDALHVVNYCVKNNVEVRLYNVFATRQTDGLVDGGSSEKGKSIETLARDLRREVYRKVLKEYDYVLLAHNANDNAESILMHIMRGAGLRGAKGIRQVDERTRLIRPLLHLSRVEIEEYCNKHNVPYVLDETNSEDNYTRNYLRNRVFPLLERVNERFVDNIASFGKRAQADDDCLNAIAEKLILPKCAPSEKHGFALNDIANHGNFCKDLPLDTRGGGSAASRKNAEDKNDTAFKSVSLDADGFKAAEAPIKTRAIFLALQKLGINENIEERHIHDICGFVESAKSGSEIELPTGVKALKDYNCITFFAGEKPKNDTLSKAFGLGGHNFKNICILISECDVDAKNMAKASFCESNVPEHKAFSAIFENFAEKGVTFRTKPLYFDLDLIPRNAVIRFRNDDDVFTKFGGGTKKLNDYLTDKKISKRLRDFIPLVCVGSEVLIICGVEISNKIKISGQTVSAATVSIGENWENINP